MLNRISNCILKLRSGCDDRGVRTIIVLKLRSGYGDRGGGRNIKGKDDSSLKWLLHKWHTYFIELSTKSLHYDEKWTVIHAAEPLTLSRHRLDLILIMVWDVKGDHLRYTLKLLGKSNFRKTRCKFSALRSISLFKWWKTLFYKRKTSYTSVEIVTFALLLFLFLKHYTIGREIRNFL